MKILKYIVPAVLVMLGFGACENMDKLYKDYLKEGSIYSGKIADLNVHSGYERVVLSWNNPTDDVSKRIYIGYGLSDVEKEIVIDEMVDTYEITGLSDYTTYFFDVRTMDAYDNKSLSSTITTQVFTHVHLESVGAPVFSIVVDDEVGAAQVAINNLSGPTNFFTGIEWKCMDEAGAVLAQGDHIIDPLDLEAYIAKYRGTNVTYLADDSWICDADTFEVGKNYTFEYTISYFPSIFREKTVDGYYIYEKICSDSVPVEGAATAICIAGDIDQGNAEARFELDKSRITFLSDELLYGSYWLNGAPMPLVQLNGQEVESKDIYVKGGYRNATHDNPQGPIETIWDNATAVDAGTGKTTYSATFWHNGGYGYPYSFFIDFGREVKIYAIRFFHALGATGGYSPKDFELWISNDQLAADGILNDWTKLGDYSNPAGTNTTYDQAYVEGIRHSINGDDTYTRTFRYLRWTGKTEIGPFDPATATSRIAELKFYGKEAVAEE